MTEFLEKSKSATSKHANKVVHGLSATALIWLYHTFATRESVQDLNREFRDLQAMHMNNHSEITNQVRMADGAMPFTMPQMPPEIKNEQPKPNLFGAKQ